MRVKKIIKKSISLFLVLSLLLGTLTGCTVEQLLLASWNIINSGFSVDTNSNGATLEKAITNKFKRYDEILDKLVTMNVVQDKEIYKTAMENNKEYLINALVRNKKIEEDLANSIAWIIDPQYLCRLYNDLSWIKQYYEEAESELGANKHQHSEVWGYYSSNDNFQSDDIEEIADVEDNLTDLASREELDKILEERERYWTDVIQPLAEGSGSISDISYTLSVIRDFNQIFNPSQLMNQSGGGGIFQSILKLFTGAVSEKHPPFIRLETGDLNADCFTLNTVKLNGRQPTGQDLKNFNIDPNSGTISGTKVEIKNLKQEAFKQVLEKLADSTPGCFKDQILSNFRSNLSSDNSKNGYFISITESHTETEGADDDSSSAENDNDQNNESSDFETQCNYTTAVLSKALNYYNKQANQGGRHSTGHVFADITEDRETTKDGSEIITKTYKVEFRARTCEAIYLNIKDYASELLGTYDMNTPISSLYRVASETITKGGRTLVDLPYVLVSGESNGSISTLERVTTGVKEDSEEVTSRVKGRNVCAPGNQQTKDYNTDANVPIRCINYATNVGDYNLDKLREQLLIYENQTQETKKVLGDDIIRFTDPLGTFIENPNNLFSTSNYSAHKENLLYENVLRSVAYGNSGRGAIDYNPSQEIGNDLIVTIANIPVFAIRLMEFNEYAAQDNAQAIENAKEDGYIMIITTKGDMFALDPRCRIKRIDYLDSTTNNVYLKDSDNYYNFLSSHIYKASEDNHIVPTDQIAQGDRDYITKKFIDGELFNKYFGPSEKGKLLLYGYEPLYYEPDEDLVAGNWFPLGRTLFLNMKNISTNWREHPNYMTILDYNQPIGYLANPSTNRPNSNAANASPVYMRDLCDRDNTGLDGEEIPRISIGSRSAEDEFEDYTSSRTGDFKGTAFMCPRGEFVSSSENWWYKITEEPTENSEHYKQLDDYWYPAGGYFWCICKGPDAQEKYYLFNFDEDGYLSVPDEEKYQCLFDLNEDESYEDYQSYIIGNSGNKNGFCKSVNETAKKNKTIDRVSIIKNIANKVKGLFEEYTQKAYFNKPQEGDFYLRIENKDVKNRKDCSSFASYITVLLDEEIGFTGKHLYDSNLYLYSTIAMAEQSNLKDTNYKVEYLTGINSKADIKNKIKPGDYILYPGSSTDENRLGHVMLVIGVTDSKLTIYQWTSGSARGGPIDIPITDIDTRSLDGCCFASSGHVVIRIPDIQVVGRTLNDPHDYTHILKSNR